MDSNDAAYAAGLVDGEGCISVADNGCGYIVLHIAIGMKQGRDEAILWLGETFPEGGLHRSLAGPNRCPMTYWQVSGQTARGFLQTILPFVKTKKHHVEVALAFLDIPKGSKSDEATLLRFALAEELRNR